MERLQYGLVVIELCEGCFQSYKKCIVHSRMPYIMSNGRDQECQRIERL